MGIRGETDYNIDQGNFSHRCQNGLLAIVNYSTPITLRAKFLLLGFLDDFVLIRRKRGHNATMQKSDERRFDNFYSSALSEGHPIYACRKYNKYHCKINFSRAPCLLAHFTYNIRMRYMPQEKVFDIQLTLWSTIQFFFLTTSCGHPIL